MSVHLERNNYKYSNIMASRGVPILFILVSFLIIANTRCDQVGSSNAPRVQKLKREDHAAKIESSGEAQVKQKYDPLNMFREIYLDHDSKTITMLLPSGSDSVQKFHPNGRYGRRSVSNFPEPATAHTELGRLVLNSEDGSPLRSILQSYGNQQSLTSGAHYSPLASSTRQPPASTRQSIDGQPPLSAEQQSGSNYQLELNKLLKCNYSGVSNLYYCDTGN